MLEIPTKFFRGLAFGDLKWFTPVQQVPLERQTSGSGRAAKSAVAGLLAGLLLLVSLFSVSHTLHRAVHGDGAGGHVCLACSLAGGQVDASDVAVVCALLVAAVLFSVRCADSSFQPDFRYCFSQSRAPPRR